MKEKIISNGVQKYAKRKTAKLKDIKENNSEF